MTEQSKILPYGADFETLTAHLLSVFPTLDETGQRLALTLYRELSQGNAVSTHALAGKLQLPEGDVIATLRGWPGVYYDDSRSIIGFWGLTITPMPHRLRTNGRALYAWCAWDTLFLPELIANRIDVESACRVSGQPVRLTATPNGVERADPPELVLSFLLPEAEAMNANVITSFCHHVHFFRSSQTALPWLAEQPDAFLLSLADAYQLGRRINRARYDESLLRGVEMPTNGLFRHAARAPR
jgi:alkylmercury lyase